MTAFVICYTLTSGIGGYGGGAFYARYSGKHWIQVFLLTCLLLPGLFFTVLVVLNIIASSYGSLAYVPAGTMVLACNTSLFFKVI